MRLSSGVWDFCHLALALRLKATIRFMSMGREVDVRWGALGGVASCAACNILMKSSVADAISSSVLSFGFWSTFSLSIFL
jgi:hypothetical protein